MTGRFSQPCRQAWSTTALSLAFLAFSALFQICAGTSLPTTSAKLTQVDKRTWAAVAAPGELTIPLLFAAGPAFVLDQGANGQYVLPTNASIGAVEGNGNAWVLPSSLNATEPAWFITSHGGVSVSYTPDKCQVIVQARSAILKSHRARPHADVQGAEYALDFPGSGPLLDALAGFYWGTILPSVIEHTLASSYPNPEGFVLSTLASQYAGTYPDVDHEFQIKGRLAMGSSLDLDVVRRMMELQLRMMREDPAQLWRAPCAVQPSGAREYHVRRNSMDGKVNANMFLITGNVELIQEAWMYIARTKDLAWLRKNIDVLEGGAWLVEAQIDQLGRLWGDVYYEDQVMKDGRETFSQVLAAHSFDLLAQLEGLVGRNDSAARYSTVSRTLLENVAQPLPLGSWDADNARFVDWVDRSGLVHDHIHLLANVLPVMFGAATGSQLQNVLDLVDRELDEFQRFPTFLAARIANYSDSEIGDGGPYDLCAAGRYWCWDAAFWSWRHRGDMLLNQLQMVASMGASEEYIMGERYDMDYVYYVDGIPWHGAAHYYEYPCVYTWVMMTEFLGVKHTLDADLLVSPQLVDYGSVTLSQSAYQLSYEYGPGSFTLRNLASSTRSFAINTSALYPSGTRLAVQSDGASENLVFDGNPVILAPGASLKLVLDGSPSTEL